MQTRPVYTEIRAKSALHKLKRKIPYSWDLNLYRGCQHNCIYCYAIYAHEYLTERSIAEEIFVKTNIAEELERELSDPGWQREVINIGGVTDCYQPAEGIYRLMPEILKLLIRHKTPAIISTKSALVLEDYDLIDQLSRITYVNIAATITTCDEDLRCSIEPEAAPAAERFQMLKEFRKTNASLGLHLMPIIPYLTDSEKNLDQIFSLAGECGVDYLLPGTLYLRGSARKRFFDYLAKEHPALNDRYSALYKTGGADKDYKNNLYRTVNRLRATYNISGSYMKPMREKLSKNQ